MSLDICGELAGVLQSVRRPGDFFVAGSVSLPAPRLVVEGVGEISLPVLPVQAAQLIAQAERAPYGRGEQTLLDTNVRRTWQIAPERLSFLGRHWEATLGQVLAQLCAGLGVEDPVTAGLYKLLVYDPGSFFISHRDTEKAPGMFATLVVAMPGLCEGGELVVRHAGREARLDLANGDPSELTFAAFYADCVHEVLPVTAGHRVMLVYNLIRTGQDTLQPPSYPAQAAQLGGLLRGWGRSKDQADDDTPEKVVYLLEHAYSPAELGFARLKGADAAAGALLASVAPEAGCDLHLALLSINESGSAEHHWTSRHGYEHPEEGHYEVIEVIEHTQLLSEWRRPDGAPVTLGAIPLEEEGDEVSPSDGLESMQPDEEHFHEATGNEGASFERTYRRAALVLWPTAHRLAVLNQAGPRATLPYLASLATRWLKEGSPRRSPVWLEAHELSGHMLKTWSGPDWHAAPPETELPWRASAGTSEPSRDGAMARLLAALTALGDEARAEAALALLIAQPGHDKDDNPAILDAIGMFPGQQAARFLEEILAAHAGAALDACAALLEAALAGSFKKGPRRLTAATRALIAALPGDPAAAPVETWGARRKVTVDAGVIAALIPAAERVDAGLAEQLAAHLLAWPECYGLDRALIPAVKQLLQGGASRSGAALSALITACLAHLAARAAEPLEAPRDWARPAEIRCTCQHCAALRSFLASPAQPEWTLWAAERTRQHVEHSIRAAHADLEWETIRKGSPHGLFCQKTSASHDRRVAQRHRDLADLAQIKGTRAVS
jgi:predicted 2-oxoglutarate/Fe(II)-dependent dioxygenase YbiX